MAITPQFKIALPLFYAQQTLAASQNCQTLLGAASAGDAVNRIFPGETDEHADSDIRPRVLLDVLDGMEWDKISTTGFLGNGTVEAVFEIPTPPDYQGDANRRAARTWFYNAIGAIVEDVMALAGEGGYLNVLNIALHTIGRADPKENDGVEFWVAVLDLKWQG